ncbi:2Fe-2S iron-sulfur cluster-binding protein [Streptomyces sp. NPDC049541]|uniref:2Fe-2S iron-sulfur cluster-binding protein n=1 Tax=Streptomyces sp. NPDC049541 TaxID=3365594 RepID=UPI0037A59689
MTAAGALPCLRFHGASAPGSASRRTLPPRAGPLPSYWRARFTGDGAGYGDGAKAGDATEFTVRIASTGTGYRVPADRTIAEVLTAHGVEVELSCEQGICGACLTPVLAGEPDHRDEVQTPNERAAGGRITICCSRARSPELLLGL